MTFLKGNILWVPYGKRDRSKLKHAAIVWDEFYDGGNDFNGIMLTHSEPTDRFDNILMLPEHFETGLKYGYDNTHFVNQVFTKFHDWGPFYLVGNLTEMGIKFIESRISDTEPLEYLKYIRR